LRRLALNLPAIDHLDLAINSTPNEVSSKFSNVEAVSTFKDLKSGNMSFLSPDKNARLVHKLHSNQGQLNMSGANNNLADIVDDSYMSNSSISENSIYNSASSD
jgi:hypothetical protein